MIARVLLVSSVVVAGLAVPAYGAEADADGCTTSFVGSFLDRNPDPHPYPIVEADIGGTVAVHPQNVVPAATYFADSLVPLAESVVVRTAAFVECAV